MISFSCFNGPLLLRFDFSNGRPQWGSPSGFNSGVRHPIMRFPSSSMLMAAFNTDPSFERYRPRFFHFPMYVSGWRGSNTRSSLRHSPVPKTGEVDQLLHTPIPLSHTHFRVSLPHFVHFKRYLVPVSYSVFTTTLHSCEQNSLAVILFNMSSKLITMFGIVRVS